MSLRELGTLQSARRRAMVQWLVDAVRCLECGATRWTMFGANLEHLLGEPCAVCGGETVVERRRPGTGARKVFLERRDLGEHEQAAGPAPASRSR
jgi:hypothetical protein